MYENLKFYIYGKWIDPAGDTMIDVIDPADESVAGQVALGNTVDVDKAVAAARRAFEDYSQASRNDRLALLDRVITEYQKRMPDLASAMSKEMGAPAWL